MFDFPTACAESDSRDDRNGDQPRISLHSVSPAALSALAVYWGTGVVRFDQGQRAAGHCFPRKLMRKRHAVIRRPQDEYKWLRIAMKVLFLHRNLLPLVLGNLSVINT